MAVIRILLLFLFLTSCSFAADVPTPPDKTIQQAVEELQSDDPRKAKVELLTWKIRYWQEYLKTIRLEYQGKCYDDRRYRTGRNEIDKLSNEIRRLLLP